MKKRLNILLLILALGFAGTESYAMRQSFNRMRKMIVDRMTHLFSSRIRSGVQSVSRFFKSNTNEFNTSFKKPVFFNGLAGLIGIASTQVYKNSYAQGYEQRKQAMNPATIWAKIGRGDAVSEHDMKNHFVLDCEMNKHQNELIPKHKKNDQTVRIATYNVHFFRDVNGQKSLDEIIKTIQDINPDILVLQEVSIFDQWKLKEVFAKIGFRFNNQKLFCKSKNVGQAPFGNMVLSKYELAEEPVVDCFEYDKKFGATLHYYDPRENRCYVKAKIALPNNKKITIFGTHLDVFDESETRRSAEIAELITKNQQSGEQNVVIAADYNAIRKKDYLYTVNKHRVWDLVRGVVRSRYGLMTVPTKALDSLENNQFQDSFTKAGFDCPKWTVWAGAAVDFMYLNKQWNLPVVGSYVYYSAASDHLPIIMDVNVQ